MKRNTTEYVKRNPVAISLMVLVVLFFIPIVVYFWKFHGVVSADHNDWIAFGGLAYGLAIVIITAYSALLNYRMHQEVIKLQEVRQEESKKQSIYREFLSVNHKLQRALDQELKEHIYREIQHEMEVWESMDISVFQDEHILSNYKSVKGNFWKLWNSGLQPTIAHINRENQLGNTISLDKYLRHKKINRTDYDEAYKWKEDIWLELSHMKALLKKGLEISP